MADDEARQFLRDDVLPPRGKAVPSSIEFLKERIGSVRQLHAMRYQDEAGGHWDFIYGVERDDDGNWRICGGFGGGGGPSYEHMARAYPWVNLGATWGATGLLAGGQVSDN